MNRFVPSALALRLPAAVCVLLLAGVCSGTVAQDNEPALEMKFGAFFRQPIGPRGLEFSDALRAAQGRRVRLVGYIVAQERPTPGRFMLAPLPIRMSDHADGDADDLPPATVMVHLAAGQRDQIVAQHDGLVSLSGRLDAGRVEEGDGRVSWVRLHLDAASVTAQPSFANNQ